MSRGTLPRGSYVITALDRQPRKMPRRLLELLLCVMPPDDPDYLEAPEAGHFAVVDMKTGERGLFEREAHATDDVIDGMVAGHFDAIARRVGPRVWAA